MRQIILIFTAILLISACSTTSKKTDNEYDFKTYNWGDSSEKIKKNEEPKQARIFEREPLEIEYEGTFLGVSTDLDNSNVARMSFFFEQNKLKGAWYYIYTNKEKFDMSTQIDKIKAKLGTPTKHSFDKEENADNFLWLNDKTATKLFARNAGDKYRFELYYYERKWFDANMQNE